VQYGEALCEVTDPNPINGGISNDSPINASYNELVDAALFEGRTNTPDDASTDVSVLAELVPPTTSDYIDASYNERPNSPDDVSTDDDVLAELAPPTNNEYIEESYKELVDAVFLEHLVEDIDQSSGLHNSIDNHSKDDHAPPEEAYIDDYIIQEMYAKAQEVSQTGRQGIGLPIPTWCMGTHSAGRFIQVDLKSSNAPRTCKQWLSKAPAV